MWFDTTYINYSSNNQQKLRYMGNRNYIRKLRHTSLSVGYISTSAFTKGPVKIFLCVWPSEPSIKERVHLFVRKNANTGGLSYELVLPKKACEKRKFVLKFSKTSTAFDKQGFFWTATKGHHFEIQGDCNLDEAIFAANFANNNRFFADLLQVLGETSDHDISLADYLNDHYDIITKNTYALAVYIQVKFWSDRIHIGESSEEVYRLEDLSFLQDVVEVNNLLYEYPRPKKGQQQPVPQKQDIDTIHVSETKDIASQEVELDVREVFKECISPFIEKFRKVEPQDEDYSQLIENLLGKLSGISNDI